MNDELFIAAQRSFDGTRNLFRCSTQWLVKYFNTQTALRQMISQLAKMLSPRSYSLQTMQKHFKPRD